MKLTRISFKPKLIPSLATLVMLPFLIHLGFWQLDRAAEKRHIQTQLTSRANAAPLSLQSVGEKKGDVNYYPIKLVGHFDNQHQFLLDNKTHKRQAGYHVLTPFISNGSKKIVLVDRGWIPVGKSRSVFPTIKPVQGKIKLFGKIYAPSKKSYVLSNQIEKSLHGLVRIQAIDYAQLGKLMKKDFYPFLVQMDPQSAHGFVREWKAISTKPEKHDAYAFQWFALAFALSVIFIAVTTKIKE